MPKEIIALFAALLVGVAFQAMPLIWKDAYIRLELFNINGPTYYTRPLILGTPSPSKYPHPECDRRCGG